MSRIIRYGLPKIILSKGQKTQGRGGGAYRTRISYLALKLLHPQNRRTTFSQHLLFYSFIWKEKILLTFRYLSQYRARFLYQITYIQLNMMGTIAVQLMVWMYRISSYQSIRCGVQYVQKVLCNFYSILTISKWTRLLGHTISWTSLSLYSSFSEY